ncbi:MAG: ABC transporter ATP-binding protein [Peptostreptococcaceae bacterium]|nr:ABC transporter ATP-binding protein [Peptostreptococcaceae bacterium]
MLINRILLQMASSIKKEMIFLSILTFISGIASICQAFMISKMINGIISKTTDVWKYALFFFFALALQILLKYAINYLTIKMESIVKETLRNRAYDQLYSLGLQHLNEERTGKLNLIFLDRIEALAPYYSTYIPNLFNVMIVSIGCVFYIASFDFSVAFIALLGILGVLFVPSLTYKYLWSTGTEVWQEYEQFSAEFLDNLQGMETLKNLKACNIRKQRMKDISREIHKKTMDNMKITTIENFLFEMSANLGSILSIAYSAYLSLNGVLSIQDVVIILFLIRSCFSPVYALMNAWHLGYNGLTASAALQSFFEEKKPKWRVSFSVNKEKKLSVTDLSFSYYEGQSVLKNIQLEVEIGKIHALVGKSGDGKSTLASLIAGLYAYTEGNIQFLGLGLSESTADVWRNQVGAVWQHPYIFHGSLRDNLLFAKADATEQDLMRAIELANLSEVVAKLPQGLDSSLGENGNVLSGGEKQRVAIARCFLKNAELLILDEATSSLDEKNQQAIQESMERLVRGKTTIIIAHRLSTIENADCCHMLKNGEIIAKGTYDELLNSCSEFKNMVESQQGGLYETK